MTTVLSDGDERLMIQDTMLNLPTAELRYSVWAAAAAVDFELQ